MASLSNDLPGKWAFQLQQRWAVEGRKDCWGVQAHQALRKYIQLPPQAPFSHINARKLQKRAQTEFLHSCANASGADETAKASGELAKQAVFLKQALEKFKM